MKLQLYKEFRKAMTDHEIKWAELAEYCNYNTGANLSTGIKTGTLKDEYFLKACNRLGLDVGEMYKLKLKARGL